MHTPRQTRQRSLTGKRKSLPNVPPPAAPATTLPRKIAPGVFFVNWSGDSKDQDTLPSPNMLVNLEITHVVVARGSDLGPSFAGTKLKALFVGTHDPLSRVVAWMRAVRRLGAHIIVGDVAAATGYLVVELGLTPRVAWLRIGHGIPPAGDYLLSRLYVLAHVQNEKGKENGAAHLSECTSGGEYTARRFEARSRTRVESGLKHVFVSV